jgi:hypothetical protein
MTKYKDKSTIKGVSDTNINTGIVDGIRAIGNHRIVNDAMIDSLNTQDEHDNTLYGCQYRPLASDFNGSGPYNPNTDLKVAITPALYTYPRMLVPTSADIPYAVWRWNGTAWVLYYNILFNRDTGVHTKIEVPSTVTNGAIAVMQTATNNEKNDVVTSGTIQAANIQQKLDVGKAGKLTMVGSNGFITHSDYDIPSLITACQTNQSDLGIVQVTFPYTITQANIDAGTVSITLPDQLRPNFHVHATLQGVPLSIGSINSVAKGTGSISYTEGTNIVTINFNNTTDFGATPYKVQPGWLIEVKYTKIVMALTPISNVSVTAVTGTYNSSDDSVSYTYTLNNTGDITETVTVTLVLTDSADTVVSSTTATVDATVGNSPHTTQHYTGLAPDTYTLTASLNGSSASGAATIPALTAIFQPVDATGDGSDPTEVLVGERGDGTITLTQRIKNIGNAVGRFELYLKLFDTTSPTPNEISANGSNYFQGANIAPGETVMFVRIISGVTNIEYNGYSKCDDTKYLYNSGDNTYTII